MSLQVLLEEAMRKAMSEKGLKGNVNVVGNDLVLVISKEEIITQLMSAIPEQLKPFTTIEAGDIKIKMKLVIGT
jgi:hypothetical protein